VNSVGKIKKSDRVFVKSLSKGLMHEMRQSGESMTDKGNSESHLPGSRQPFFSRIGALYYSYAPLKAGPQKEILTMRQYIMILAGVLIFLGGPAGTVYGIDGEAAGKLNVNIATRDELSWFLLRNGIGSPVTRAESIIEYRRENGPFGDIEEIRNVVGIGEFEFGRIQPWIKVQGLSDYRPKQEGYPSGYFHPGPAYPRDGPSRGDFPPDDEPYGPWRIRP